MGTNYDARINCCKSCGRYDSIHIGKSSHGWTFSFHATDDIRSWSDWKKFLDSPDVSIVDEYGDPISYKEFVKLVSRKKKEAFNHTIECRKTESPDYCKRIFLDDEGNSFSEGEFC